MREWIITNLTDEEESILEKNDIEWYPDTLDSRDIVFHGSNKELDEVLKLIGRK